jgi:hypothetical protein
MVFAGTQAEESDSVTTCVGQKMEHFAGTKSLLETNTSDSAESQ